MAVEMMYGVVRSAPEDTIAHIGRSKLDGAPKGSGRYPLGSGEDPRALKKKGAKEKLAKLSPEQKQEIIDTGNAKEAYKHRREFTNDELAAVKKRFEMEKSINDLTQEKVKTGWDYVDSVTKHGEQIVKFTETGINIYNTAARVINAVQETDLPVIPKLDDLIKRQSPAGKLELRKAEATAELQEKAARNADEKHKADTEKTRAEADEAKARAEQHRSVADYFKKKKD